MISSCIKSLVKDIENFVNFNSENFSNNDSNINLIMSKIKSENFLVVFISFLIVILIISLIGQFLWNYVMHGPTALVKGCNEAKSIWQILALYILISLFIGR